MDVGALYLGQELDPKTGERSEDKLSLPSHHLTTHGVIVGMTGSGKTGLGVVLLEEILASGIPALIIDPKGDMGNLALTFPEFRASDFRPWIDEGTAEREGLTPDELATKTAEKWKSGLEASGIDADRMRRLRDSVDLKLFTPGSSAGIGLNVLGDLTAPNADWDEHGETIREEIEGTISGLLVLAGIEADPLTSREHILLSNLVEHAWRAGRDLDLPTLLGQIQNPPLRRLGIFELDTFFPPADRTKLAMRLNGLVASPSFAEWLTGAPLDMELLLRAPDGRPRASVVYLSHLSDDERQFVLTLLLSKAVTWMRQQPGTSDLQAAIYIDEVFGFAPPTAEPPSKRPLLTLYKQARAHGLGVIVATQNPVDLDYKIMSNAGTWMIGRLQTERDKNRIIEALKSATGDVDVADWDKRIGGLGKREFVLRSARTPQPTLFTTRWAMSYLKGPITRSELSLLPAAQSEGPEATSDLRAAKPSEPAGDDSPALQEDESPVQPATAKGVKDGFLDPAAPWRATIGAASEGSRLLPGLAVRVDMVFDEAKAGLKHDETWEAVVFPLDEAPDLSEMQVVDHDPRDFSAKAPEDARYVLPRAPIGKTTFFSGLKKSLEDELYRERSVTILRNAKLKMYSRVGEAEEAFLERCLAKAEDMADAEAEKLRSRYEKRLRTARRRVADSERRVRELDTDVDQRRQQEMIAGAGEVLSLFLGGRRRVRSLSGVASRRSTTRRTQERLQSAAEQLAERQDAIQELEADLNDELEAIWERWQTIAEDVESLDVGLEKTDIRVTDVTLFWAPAS